MTEEETKLSNSTRYSPIRSMHIENFMGIVDSTIDFDDNFVNLKGMNNTGKSAVIKAFRVLMTQFKPNSRRGWIRWGTSHFGLTLTFQDGVSIYYEKRTSGKSCYEIMNETGEVIFTTRENGIYAPIVEIPEPVDALLGMLKGKGITPNFLKSREPLFIVDTTGKTNYDFLSKAIEAPDVNRAKEYLKDDLKSSQENLRGLNNRIKAYQDMLVDLPPIYKTTLEKLKSLDRDLDNVATFGDSLNAVKEEKNQLDGIHILPKLDKIDTSNFDELFRLGEVGVLKDKLDSIRVLPKIGSLNQEDLSYLKALNTVSLTLHNYQEIEVLPSLSNVKTDLLSSLLDLKQSNDKLVSLNSQTYKVETISQKDLDLVKSLQDISNSYKSLEQCNEEVTKAERNKAQLGKQLKQLETELRDDDLVVFQCKDCGHLNVFDKNRNPLTDLDVHEGVMAGGTD